MIDFDRIDALAGGITDEQLRIESLFSLGARYSIGGLSMNQPAAGHCVLLNVMGSPFVMASRGISEYAVREAAFILSTGRESADMVLGKVAFANGYRNEINAFFESISFDLDVARALLSQYFSLALNGFKMIPSSDGESEPKAVTFDSEWLSGYVSICHSITGMDYERVLWDLPLVFGGFCVARKCVESGAKGIEREKDWKKMLDELKRQMEASDNAAK